MKRNLKNRLDRLESQEKGGEDGEDLLVIRESRVDENGESELFRTTRYGFDENGDWYSVRVDNDE